MNTQNFIKKQKGLTLIESLIALVILGFVVTLVAPRILNALDRNKDTQVITDLGMLRQAAAAKKGIKSNYSGITCANLVNDEYINNNWTDCSGVNPYDGDYQVTANSSDGRNVDISATGLTTAACNRIAETQSDAAVAAACSGTTVTVTYGG